MQLQDDKTKVYMTFVAEELKKKKITQVNIGKTLNIKQSAVSSLLKGNSKVSLEQFVLLCKLIEKEPIELIAEAETNDLQTVTIPKEQMDILLKTELHFLFFCEANVPVNEADLIGNGINYELAHSIFSDLKNAGLLLETEDGKYVQENPKADIFLMSNDRALQIKKKIVERCWDLSIQKIKAKEPDRNRQHSYFLNLFTAEQIRELQVDVERICSKLNKFKVNNQKLDYSAANLKLWCIDLLMMNPLKE